MMLGRYRQRPNERRKRGVDYTDFLESSEVVTQVLVTVLPVTVPPFVVGSVAIDPAGKKFAYFSEDGLDGETYTADLKVVTNGTQIKRDTIEFDVQEDE